MRAEVVKRLASICRMGDCVEDVRGFGRNLRQLDVAAHAGIWKAPCLQMSCIGEHDLRELELRLGQCLGRETSKTRRYVLTGVEAIGIGVLQSGDDCFGTGILNSIFHPERGEIATFIKRQHRRALILVRKKTV